MNLIAAVDKNWGIGNERELLTHIPADLKHFKEKTEGNTIVMGRKTLESLPRGKPLPNRENVVITKQKDYAPEGVTVIHSIDEVDVTDKNTFVIGGGEIYKQMLKHCSTAYITKIDNEFEADTYFPNLDEMGDWVCTEVIENPRYNFCRYERIR